MMSKLSIRRLSNYLLALPWLVLLIFFVDDLHLAPDSLLRTRKALNEFIDHGMGDKDEVAITSPSGQIGFLQQFTDDKAALGSAVARLSTIAQTLK